MDILKLDIENKNNYWNNITNSVFTDKVKTECIQIVDDWYKEINIIEEYSNIIKITREYFNNNKKWSYGGLTNYSETNNITWHKLNEFRSTIFNKAKYSIVVNFDITTDNNIQINGSNSKGSDIDITITDEQVKVTLLFSYFFGLFSIKLFYPTEICDMCDKQNVDMMIQVYLNTLFFVEDIATYSSNGMIVTKEPIDVSICPSSKRYLIEIKKNMYQNIHRKGCDNQNKLYKIIAVLLLLKLKPDILFIKGIDDNIDEKFHQLNDKFILSLDKNETTIVNQLNKIREDNIFNKFKIQIYASAQAESYSKYLVSNKCDDETFCELAAEWEKYQIVSNIVSPESAWGVQTFVAVVLTEQKKMGATLLLPSDDLWIVFIENFGNILHQYIEDDIRKAYKYVMRTLFVFNGITGLHEEYNFEKEEYDKLREKIENKKQIKKRIITIVNYFYNNIYNIAPGFVTYIINN
jgi:hypothetical protein